MTMQALPGSALEVIETEFFFQLLMCLLANPSCLDSGRRGSQISLCRQIGEIVFLLSRHPVFADEPSLVTWQMLLALILDPLLRAIGDPHADGGETGFELAFCASAPANGPPFGSCQHVFGGLRWNIGNVLAGTAMSGDRPDHLHIGGVYLEEPWNTDRPGQVASCEPLAERRAHPITGICQHAAKAHTSRDDTIDLHQGHLRLGLCCSIFGRNTRSLQPSPLARPTLGKKQPQRQRDRHLASRKRQRYQGLAVGGLTQRRSILRSDTHRMRAFLGYRGVVDYQHGIAAADEPICLNKQLCLHWSRIPDPVGNEVVQLIVVTMRKPLGHRAEYSCDRQDRSAPTRRADTFVAAPCDP